MARRLRRDASLAGAAAVAAAILLLCSRAQEDAGPPPEAASPPTATSEPPAEPRAGARRPTGPAVPVLRVVDGDTFHVLRDGRDVTIRLIGIDTPEVDWYGGEAECYGSVAGRFGRRLLGGERVRLEFDQERLDRYGRTLAYAYLGGQMVNVLLVRRGFALVTIYEPNDRYEPRLRAAERAARAEGAGLWRACR